MKQEQGKEVGDKFKEVISGHGFKLDDGICG